MTTQKWVLPEITQQHTTANTWPVMVYNNDKRRWVEFKTLLELQAVTPDKPEPVKYPITIEWPGPCWEIYYTPAMLNYGYHTQALLKDCRELGGVKAGYVEE